MADGILACPPARLSTLTRPPAHPLARPLACCLPLTHSFLARRIFPQTSALISLFHQTLHNDVKARFCRVEASFEAFKTTLMDHAVERPPWSSGVFSAEEVDEIVDFGLRTYFAQHKLYRGALGRTPRLVIKQTRPGLVAEPRPRRALAGAVKIVRRPSGDEGAAGFTADEEAEISAAVSARMSALQQKIES